MTLYLTWSGFTAAVDVIAAQCERREVVCGMDRAGQVLAWALSERLDIECASRPCNGALLVWGLIERAPRTQCSDPAIWAWVDATPRHRIQSVVKASVGTVVLMPWQHA